MKIYILVVLCITALCSAMGAGMQLNEGKRSVALVTAVGTCGQVVAIIFQAMSL